MKTGKHTRSSRILVLLLAMLMLISSTGATAVFADESSASGSAANAAVKDGFVKESGKGYLYQNGSKYTNQGKVQYKGYWYYIQKDGSAAANAFVKVPNTNGKKRICYYDENGHAVSGNGFTTIGKYQYYIKNFTVVTGWKTIGGKRYYFNPKKNGRMVTGTKKISGTKYTFNDKGVLQLGDPSINKKAQKYSSPTKYLIMVNRGKHKVSIYEGKKKKWKCIKYWPCVVGQIIMPTPTGVHHLTGYKGKYFDSHGMRWWYFTCYKGDKYHFHSQGYKPESTPKTVLNGQMGVSGSAGCIRLYVQNAKWLQNHMPKGTTVVVYN